MHRLWTMSIYMVILGLGVIAVEWMRSHLFPEMHSDQLTFIVGALVAWICLISAETLVGRLGTNARSPRKNVSDQGE